MRSKVLGIITALVCALVLPSVALAIPVPKKEDAPASGGSVKLSKPTAGSISKGMAAAPGVISGAALPCALKNANFILDSTEKVDKKDVKVAYYELACTDGEGFIVGARANGTYNITDCVMEAARSTEKVPNPVSCQLPENANLAATLKPVLVKAKSNCDPIQTKLLGQTATGSVVYEVACRDKTGVRLMQDTPRTATSNAHADNCYDLIGSANPCTLVSEADLKAAVAVLATKADQPCTVSGQRYVGSVQATGARYYEFACQGGPGIIVQANVDGSYAKTVPCVQAGGLGGCKLSDSKVAATSENGLYTRLAKGAGFNCDVNKYGAFPPQLVKAGTEAVELSCSNRPDSAVALFGQTNEVMNCVHAESEGLPCTYSPKSAAYAQLVADLKANKAGSTCDVTDARPMGKNTSEAFVEVMCSDGFGSVLVYPLGQAKIKEVLTCNQANAVGGCKLKKTA